MKSLFLICYSVFSSILFWVSTDEIILLLKGDMSRNTNSIVIVILLSGLLFYDFILIHKINTKISYRCGLTAIAITFLFMVGLDWVSSLDFGIRQAGGGMLFSALILFVVSNYFLFNYRKKEFVSFLIITCLAVFYYAFALATKHSFYNNGNLYSDFDSYVSVLAVAYIVAAAGIGFCKANIASSILSMFGLSFWVVGCILLNYKDPICILLFIGSLLASQINFQIIWKRRLKERSV